MAGSQRERAERRALIRTAVLTTQDEFQEAVELQRRIWGFADIELLPVRLFVVASKVGGHSLGAYDGDRMIAFLLAIPGLKHGETPSSYLHSHMLGVLPEYANLGIGRMLKMKQREIALENGIPLVEWTFDPLELKNAWFNIERLGAIVRRYVMNQYGTTTSHLHGGLPTDRLVAEWWVGSDRANAIAEGRPYERPAVEARIEFPSNIATLRREDSKTARKIQEAAGDRFQQYFQEGLAVIGFERTAGSGIYLLGQWE
jgi:predicted GNAT superfamily acetyltransferase